MTRFEKVCRIEQVPRGTVGRFHVAGQDILLAHTTEGYYAMDCICSHKKGNLSKGRLEGKTIHCPVHGAQFDLTSGKVIKNISPVARNVTGSEATRLRSYPVRVDEGVIWIEI